MRIIHSRARNAGYNALSQWSFAMEKHRKKHGIMIVAKALMVILTAVYPLFMVVLSGAGLIYNRESYGSTLTIVGGALIASGVIMSAGAILCLFGKNITSALCSGGGLALCMAMLHKLCEHADRAGWSDKFTMAPISDMYKARILPCIVPVALAAVIATVQYYSYESAEERRRRRESKEEAANAPAAKIIDD